MISLRVRPTPRAAEQTNRSCSGRVRRREAAAVFQPVLAHYRVGLLNELGCRLGGRVVLFTEAPSPRSGLMDGSEAAAIPICRSRTHKFGPCWFVPQALNVVASGRWSAVVLSWNVRQLELLPALVLARLTRTPVILWGHGLGRSGSAVALLVRTLQARLATAVVVYSESGAKDVRRVAPRTPVVVAQNTTGRPSPSEGDELRVPTGTVGYIGRLDARKRLDRLLEAVAELRRRGVVLRVALMGDGPEAASLRAQAQALGLAEVVTFREASSDWHAVKAHLLGLDVTVFPEIGGLGVVDSFAAARGAVVLESRTRNPPEAEMVVEGVTGARYSSADVNSLADALTDLYRDDDLLPRVSKQAGELYRSSLTMDAAVEPMRKVIEPLLDVRRRRDDG